MDPVDVVILALRVALVALLYLFLVLVMRSAVRGLRQAPAGLVEQAGAGLQLVVLEAGGSQLAPGQVIQLSDSATLGRAERAEVVVADTTVSAEHARIRRVGQRWVVSDLGSTNGTRVNDARVLGDTPLLPGDVVALGNVRLQVAVGR